MLQQIEPGERSFEVQLQLFRNAKGMVEGAVALPRRQGDASVVVLRPGEGHALAYAKDDRHPAARGPSRAA